MADVLVDKDDNQAWWEEKVGDLVVSVTKDQSFKKITFFQALKVSLSMT